MPPGARAAFASTADVLATLGERVERCPGIRGAELDRLRSLRRPADRDDALAAHLLVRSIALPPADDDERWRRIPLSYLCPGCGSRSHGAPTLRMPDGEVRASISHARGVVAAAVGGVPGVDVESAAQLAGTDPALWLCRQELTRAAGDAGYAARAWTMKEALVKVGLLRLDDVTTFDARPVVDAALAGGLWTSADGREWSAVTRIDGDAVVAVVCSEPLALLDGR